MRKFLSILVIAALVWTGIDRGWFPWIAGRGDSAIENAWRDHRSGVQVRGEGDVVRILSDDNTGRRHQRFILKLDSGHTLLISHNIDIAPRIPSLKHGDRVGFYGVYEWNAEGGVIHWTHHDPRRRHTGGWLRHKGKTYE